MKKRFLSILMALCLTLTLLPTAALAADEQQFVTSQTGQNGVIQYVESVSIPDGTATHNIFLNGNSAEITATITNDSYILNVLVNGTTYTYKLTENAANAPSIFGGRYIGDSPSADVTVEGSQTVTVDASVQLYNGHYPILRVLAGGAGDSTSYGSRQTEKQYYKAVSSGTVILNINGCVSAVRGGGSGDSTVTSSVINVSGKVGVLYGGGDAPYGTVANLTNDGTKSTCHVDNVLISITEDGQANYVFGGGYSIASVGSATVTVAGSVGTVSASGSNGYIGKSGIEIESTAVITPKEGEPAVTYGWNGYGVGAEVVNEGTINGDVLLGSWNTVNSVSGTSDTLRFTNTGTVFGEARLGNTGNKNIVLSGEITLNTKTYSDVPEFILVETQTITLSSGASLADGAEIKTAEGTVLSGTTTGNGETILGAVSGTAVATYEELLAAITNVKENDVIQLAKDIKVEQAIYINGKDTFTIDGNGFSITPAENYAANITSGQWNLLKLNNCKNVTLKNLTLRTASSNSIPTGTSNHALDIYGSTAVILENVTLDHSSANSGAPLVINQSHVTAQGNFAVVTGDNSWYGINIDDKEQEDSASLTFNANVNVTFTDNSSTKNKALIYVEVIDATSAVVNPENAGLQLENGQYVPKPSTPEVPSDPGNNTSSSSSDPSYSPILDVSDGGSIKVNPRTPEEDDEVTITVDPDSGYEVDEVTVTDRNGREVKVTAERNGTYTFTQPRGRVTISVTFVREGGSTFFSDVPESFWAYDEIAWAYDNGYVNGTSASSFSPNASISRQQVWMILARLSGADPANMSAAREWAVTNGVSDGTTPGGAVTRQQLVALLYRYATLMGYANDQRADLSAYPDAGTVAGYAVEPMQWSVANSIVGGTSNGTLDPTGTATRAQFAVILYRFWDQVG